MFLFVVFLFVGRVIVAVVWISFALMIFIAAAIWWLFKLIGYLLMSGMSHTEPAPTTGRPVTKPRNERMYYSNRR